MISGLNKVNVRYFSRRQIENNMTFFKKIHHKLVPPAHNLGYMPYLNLAYLLIFFINIYFNPVSALERVAVGLSLITFIVCYFQVFWRQGTSLAFCIATMFVIGCAMSTINVGASVFFVYAACACAGFESQRNAMYSLISIICLTGLFSALSNQSGYFWIPAVMFSTVIGFALIHQAEIDRKNQALTLSQQQVKQLAQTAERERISRDLHDILGHSLSVITLKAELASKMIDAEQPQSLIRDEIKAVEKLSRETLAQVRGAVSGYNRATLANELHNAYVATKAAGIELIEDINSVNLALDVESQLALILREATTNIIRHAKTSKAWITLTQTNNIVTLKISDEGTIKTLKPHSGILNMQERIESLGGKMDIQNAPITLLTFTMPLTGADNNGVIS